jgi:hypothetical protein
MFPAKLRIDMPLSKAGVSMFLWHGSLSGKLRPSKDGLSSPERENMSRLRRENRQLKNPGCQSKARGVRQRDG